MLQMNEEKRPKEQRNLFPSVTQLKKGHAQKNDLNIHKTGIRLLFLSTILLFSLHLNISLKSEYPKTKDILFSLDYHYGIKDT